MIFPGFTTCYDWIIFFACQQCSFSTGDFPIYFKGKPHDISLYAHSGH